MLSRKNQNWTYLIYTIIIIPNFDNDRINFVSFIQENKDIFDE